MESDVRFFVEQGYLIARGLFGAAVIDRLKEEATAIARELGERDGGAAALSPLCIHQPHAVSPVVREIVGHPALAAYLSRIVGAHLAHWDGAVKCMQSMMFVKGPGKPGQAWHQDEIHIPTRDRSLCGAWIAMDEATRENGCLSVLPGSHRTGYLFPFRAHRRPDEFDAATESYGFDDSDEVFVELAPGDVLFFNGYLLHRSRKNRSRGHRRSIVMHYMNAWSLLPWDQEPHVRLGHEVRIATADNRKVLPVAGTDPYAWKGYEPSGADDVWLRAESPAATSADAGHAR